MQVRLYRIRAGASLASRRSRAGLTVQGRAHESTAHEPVQALEAREPGRRGSPSGSKHESPAHGSPSRPSKLDRLTGSRRSWTARPSRTAASPGPGSPFQERADLVAGTSRTAHEGRSRSTRWPFSARYRASALYRPSKLDGPKHESRAHGRRRARLTVGLKATSWTGPTFEGRGQSRAGLTRARLTSPSRPSKHESRADGPRTVPGLTRARLTAHRRADGHELDRPDLRAVQGRAHEGRGLTVQALEAGPAHGLTVGLTSPSRPPKHESTAHGLTVRARGRAARPGPGRR